MEPFTERVVHIIQQIPSGKVMTYGQIARVAGNPRGARQVVRILHSLSRKYLLPWHRVINSKGEISLNEEPHFTIQKELLQSEGVTIIRNQYIDLEIFQYHPEHMTTTITGVEENR